jgi:hypothetical protein
MSDPDLLLVATRWRIWLRGHATSVTCTSILRSSMRGHHVSPERSNRHQTVCLNRRRLSFFEAHSRLARAHDPRFLICGDICHPRGPVAVCLCLRKKTAPTCPPCTHKSRLVSSGWSTSALPPKADIRQRIEHVCFGSLADILTSPRLVRFTPDSRHSIRGPCPLSATSGRRDATRAGQS